jgi:hypothetical protein
VPDSRARPAGRPLRAPTGARRALARAAGRIAVAGLAAALLCLLAACAAFDSTFGKQEAVAQFRANTALSVMLKVRASCAHIPGTWAEPIPRHALRVQMQDDIRYEVGNASDADLAKLQQCLQKFPAVVGIEFDNPEGD